jgi:pectinesterase
MREKPCVPDADDISGRNAAVATPGKRSLVMRRLILLGIPLVLLLCGGTIRTQTTTQQSISPDITVAADGTGNFKTVHAAIASIPKDNHERKIVFVEDGIYHEKVRIDEPFVTLRGQSRSGSRIEFAQLNDDFAKNPDDIGRAVVNINATDCVLENLTITNTAGVVGPHAFAVYGTTCDRTVMADCDVLSDGADTVSLWQADAGRYYHVRCNFRGAVDFVCPRGSCYIADSTFYETKKTAAIWHDGARDKEMKFVLRRCKFDGVEGWNLARHHHDAQFFLLDCTFARSMSDRPPFRVIYPLSATTAPTDADRKRNAELDKSNRWGERSYFFDCHREGGDYAWFKDNLPVTPETATAAWTFGGAWDPESTAAPTVRDIAQRENRIAVKFSESVTVRGKPRLLLSGGGSAPYVGGSGTDTLLFDSHQPADAVRSLDPGDGGSIFATAASAILRQANCAMPPSSR